ncbi:SPOR domain-containing protein [Sphingomonas sp. 28-63-12]|uniref:SPOR domain-containing protein n=1 Tax=Sphingomonas sp. 28-63-12 TaxID=1970434 RepID=UPI000BCF1F1C|nr:MAG: hypothetical protein B7Y47_04310 [Sphingomonas sp. 28-63-12]
MTSRTLATLGLSALIIGGGVVGTAVTTGSIAVASALSAKGLKQAASDAAKGQKALADGKIAAAIGYAERAVQFSPQDSSYRALLGNAYLKAGRFASARDAFTDSLSLSPADAATALSLALAQTATGDWASARKTLDDHADMIPVADRGLALALAGDPATAVEVLTQAARGPAADAKTRQNLALALALAGRWNEAKSVAQLDVAADEVDLRLQQWASFAHPRAASDQVASLLGVKAIEDQGQPMALALNAQVAAQPQMASAVDAFMPGQPGEPVAQPAAAEIAAAALMSEPAPAPAMDIAAVAPRPTVVFGERHAVVQALPANYTPYAATHQAKISYAATRTLAMMAAPQPAKLVATAERSKGAYFVQVGAFPNAAVAHDGWTRAVRRYPELARQTPSGMAVKTAAGSFYRVSIGGFARADAVTLCSAYRAQGGNCFVRVSAGDQVAHWVQTARQLAAR